MQKQNINNIYFHASPILLTPQSIILPGNWGRILKMYKRNHAGEVLLREKILEDIRRRYYSKKPSRLNAIFLLETLEEARNFRNQSNPWNLIYEVEISDPSKPLHRGDYNKVSPHPNENYLEKIEEIAHAYWKGENIQRPEIVVESPIKIIQRIE